MNDIACSEVLNVCCSEPCLITSTICSHSTPQEIRREFFVVIVKFKLAGKGLEKHLGNMKRLCIIFIHSNLAFLVIKCTNQPKIF